MPLFKRLLIFICLSIYLPQLQAIQNQLSIDTVLMDFDYAEYSDANILLDEENGALPGISLQLSLHNTTRRLLSRFQYFNGQVNYDGQTQGGIDFGTNSNEILYSFSIKQFFKHDNEARLEWLLGIELWFWDRDILSRNNVQGLFEKYQWQELSAGLSMQILQQQKQQAWLEAQLIQTLSPRMSIQLDQDFGTVTLGTNLGYRLRFIYQQALSPQWHWQLQAFVQYLEFGKSNRIAVDGFFGQSVVLVEPRSISRHRGLSIGLRYDFAL